MEPGTAGSKEAEAERAPKTSVEVEVLSESWSVDSKHTGCYSGGKVQWSEATGLLGCLYDEELHLVDPTTQLPTQRASQEGDGILTFAIDTTGENACTSHRSGLLRHFLLGGAGCEAATSSWQSVRSWKAHDQLVVDLCFDASGSFVASGSTDRSAKVWDFAGYFCTHSFRGHNGIVSLVRFHPSKLQLVTVADSELRLWDLKSSSCIGVLKDHLASISSLCFGQTQSGSYQLLSGGRDQVVNVWQLEDTCTKLRTIPTFENIEGVAALPTQGLEQVCSSSQGKLAQWLSKGKAIPPYVIVTVGDASLLKVWNPINGVCLCEHASPHAATGLFRHVQSLDVTGGSKVVTIGEDANLIVWSLPELSIERTLMGNTGEVVHVQLIPEFSWPTEDDGPVVTASKFMCITNDEHPRLVNCKGFGTKFLQGHTDVVIACDVSADGQWIATGGKDQGIRIWSATTCRCACILAGHAGAVSCLSFPKKRPKNEKSNTGHPLWLVSGSQDKTMKIWELPRREEMQQCVDEEGTELSVEKSSATVLAHSKEVNDVSVSPNNKLIASGGHDKLVRIWRFPQGDMLGECVGHRRGIWCVAFSPVDQVMASASGDHEVRLWNIKDYTAIRSFQGHTSAVLRVCFLANGMQLMSSSVDGLIKLWQIRTSDCAASFEEHEGKVWCIDILGQQMVSGGADAKLCVWRDTTAETAKERRDAEAEMAIKDSRIGLLVREGKIEQALTMALDLNRPGQLRNILADHALKVVDQCILQNPELAVEGGMDLRRWVLSLQDPQLERLMGVVEQWNSNRRMSATAQMLMSLLLLAVPPSKLASFEGMNATCGAILSYSGRHLSRVDSLLQKTFMFDLVLQSGNFGLSIEESKLSAEADQHTAAMGNSTNGNTDGGAAAGALRRTMEVLLAEEESEVEEHDEEQAVCEKAAEEESHVQIGTVRESSCSKRPLKRRKATHADGK